MNYLESAYGIRKKVVTLVLSVLLSSTGVIAQADYMTTVRVYTPDVPVEKVNFSVHRLVGNLPKPHRADVFVKSNAVFIHLGLEERGTFVIRVTAEGYEHFEFKVFFARGHMQNVAVKLKREGSTGTASLRRQTMVLGRVFDSMGSLIPKARVVAQGRSGKPFETISGEEGLFELELPYEAFFWNEKERKWDGAVEPTTYDFSVTAPGFKPIRIEKMTVVQGLRGSLHIDVVLNLQGPSPGGADMKL